MSAYIHIYSHTHAYTHTAAGDKISNTYWFDGAVLANYLVSSGNFVHPVSRRPLDRSEMIALVSLPPSPPSPSPPPSPPPVSLSPPTLSLFLSRFISLPLCSCTHLLCSLAPSAVPSFLSLCFTWLLPSSAGRARERERERDTHTHTCMHAHTPILSLSLSLSFPHTHTHRTHTHTQI